jgi:methionyl-tRNA formyltransferase
VTLRLVFMGTPDFAVPTLDAVVAAGHEVVLVVGQPDRPAGRGQKMRSPPVIERARALGLEVAQPKSVRAGPFPERFASLAPDASLVVAYGRILPAALLAVPRYGCVNVHASLLPRWRGAAPIQAAVLAGDAETGVCTQRMAEGLDTGPLYRSLATPIAAHETAGELHDRLAALGAAVAVATLDQLPGLEPTPQDDALATFAPKIGREDGRVDWSQPVLQVDRRVRAMTPWPGAWVPMPLGPLKVRLGRPTAGSGPAGQILGVSPLVVACGEGAYELVEVQAPGRRPVSGADFAKGSRLVLGARF